MSTARVDFTRGAAERIANVVRLVEQGDRDENALTFRRPAEITGSTFRIGTFEGEWDLGATATITFKYQPFTPNTVTAVNLFFDLPAPDGEGQTTDCAIARDGGTWHLVQWRWRVAVCDTTATAS